MTCVVCGGPVGEAVFANAWEKSRKVSACCSPDCASAFNPDEHWIPSRRPAEPDAVEEARLVRLAGERLRKGDRATIVTRDLLLAGVRPVAVRKAITTTKLGSESTDIATFTPTRQRGWVGALIFGAARLAGPDEDAPTHVEDALGDLDRWTKHFT